MTTKRDYYDILDIDKSASQAEIKKAYRKKALEFHPDRNKNKDAEEKFKQVNEAYEILSDPDKRKTYDQFGHAAFDPASGGPGGFGGFSRAGKTGPFTYTYTTGGANPFGGDFDFSDPFEIFESFFGGGGFARAQRKTRYSLTIDFMEAVKGTQKTIVHQGKSHTINIPAGADDGTRIRFQDFDVSVNVKPHDQFKRDGSDVFVDYQLPFTQAALGANIQVPTLEDKPLKVKIRPGTQPGSIIRLQGKGIKNLRGFGHGDLYIRLKITIPKNLNRQQKNLLQQLDQSIQSWTCPLTKLNSKNFPPAFRHSDPPTLQPSAPLEQLTLLLTSDKIKKPKKQDTWQGGVKPPFFIFQVVLFFWK